MTVERLHPDEIYGMSDEDVAAFIESDYLIRSGLCPNGHGLMTIDDGLQRCVQCRFCTNQMPEVRH